jgi:RND superfamily putative drug exporter
VAGQPQDGPAFDARLARGEALVVLGGSLDERSAILLALGGRAPVSAGRVKVAGFVLPTRAAAARARTAHVLLDTSLRGPGSVHVAVHDALRRRPEILLIDAADSFVDPELRAGIRRALGEARKGSGRKAAPPLTIVLACENGTIADALLPLGIELRTVELAAAPSAPSAMAVL